MSLWAPSFPAASILRRWLHIDTEGTSVDLLKVLLATEMFPRCICCEHDNRLVEAMQAAQGRGYKTAYTSRENISL